MTIWIVDLEAVPTRYTAQWKVHIPDLLEQNNLPVRVIDGPTDIPEATTPGAFLNFGGTNIYKSAQGQKLGELFTKGQINPGDHIVFTDAWNPVVLQVKYMSELLGIKVRLHGFWHAGSYDPNDFLGRMIGPEPWVRHTEKAMFHAFDHNYFATNFHIKMFFETLLMDSVSKENPWADEDLKYFLSTDKIVRTGWPMEYLPEMLDPYIVEEKQNLIIFPHRLAPEKQLNIFEDLAAQLPQYAFLTCQELKLRKDEYHWILGKSKMVFSANLQETLGISCMEGMLCGAFPLMPNRLSYSEMYDSAFLYPSEWTESWDHYIANRDNLVELITEIMDDPEYDAEIIKRHAKQVHEQFFSCDEFLKRLK